MGSLLSRAKELARNPQLIRNSSAAPNPELAGFSANPQNPQAAGVQRNPQPNPQPNPQAKVIHPGLEQWQVLYGQPAQKPEPAPPSAPETSAPVLDGQQQPVLSVLAELHSRPEWVAARDAWFDHLFHCDECRRNRQQIRRPFTPNPCAEGRHLCEIYENIR